MPAEPRPGSLPDLSAEVAVVTGAAGRLGAVWTGALLEAGATVVGLDLRAPAGTPASPGRFHALTADVTDRGSLGEALSACLDLAGEPTVLVNNAGIDSPPAVTDSWLLEDIPDEVSAAVLDVNVLGVLRGCQVFGARMARRGRGAVVNIGSLYGSVAPDPRLYDHIPLDPPFLKPPAYGASKAAVAALTRYLAALWGPRGVRVNTLSPGGVAAGQDPAFVEKYVARVPLGRMCAPADLTGPLLFLASDLSAYVTGTELLVDGGLTAW